MERRTVKKRIFLSNALMVIVTLVIFLIINLFVIKFYTESIEAEFRTSVEGEMCIRDRSCSYCCGVC